ncbi:MAG TPA: MauE/DoxX family redox-associated membrane protein [Longimicrobium sp.]|nr:MauE/DoxX family redox-associated membrane protein [Longimicrobium sp.]
MSGLVYLGSWILAAVFAVAAYGKARDREGAAGAIGEMGIPAALARPAAVLLPAAEALVALLLIVPAWTAAGGIGALALLAAFSAVIAANLLRGRTPECRCFGQLRSSRIGWRTLARNALLGGLAALVAWRGGLDGGTLLSDARAILREGGAVEALAAVGALVVAVQGWLILHLLRQQGRLLLRLDRVEAVLAESGLLADSVTGLPAGSPAPWFELPSLSGEPVSLDDLRAPGRALLLVFTDPGCVPCTALQADVARWERDHADLLSFALVSRGTVEANAAKLQANGSRKVLLQRDREVAEAYRVPATPGAVLIRADGTIGSEAAMGAPAIAGLVAAAAGGGVPARAAPPAGPIAGAARAGAAAPWFRLPDLDGTEIESTELQGRPTLLVFWNPACGFCDRMLPELRAWERDRPADSPEPLVISTGSVEANRAMRLRSPVVLDPHFGVGAAVGATGTPSAILVDADWTIASPVAVGAQAVLALAATAPAPAPAREVGAPAAS